MHLTTSSLNVARLALPMAVMLVTVPVRAQDVPEVPLSKANAVLKDGFKSVRTVYELKDGRLLLADGVAGKLRLANLATGAVEDRMSAGPENGDFRAVGFLWSWTGDSVAFLDAPNARLTVLSGDGRFVRAIPVGEPLPPAVVGQPPAARGPRLPALRYLASPEQAIGTGFAPRVAAPTAMSAPPRVPYPIVRFRIASMSYDTIIALLPPQQPRAFLISPTVGTLTVYVGTEALQPVDAWAMLSDGTVAVVRASTYRLDLIDAEGNRTQAGPVEYPKFTVSDGDRKQIMAAYKSGVEAQIKANARMAQVRSVSYEEPTTWPTTHPPFRGDVGARVDRRDRLWLATRCAKDEAATCYDIITRSGSRAMRLRLPDKCSVVGFGDAAVYTLCEEKGDKEVLQRHPLVIP